MDGEWLLLLLIGLLPAHILSDLSPLYHTDIILNPNRDLSFFSGETVVLQCGVYTGINPDSITIQWIGPDGKSIENATRSGVERKDSMPPDFTKPSAYAVSTLTIAELTPSDSGLYACLVNKTYSAQNQTDTTTEMLSQNMTLSVLPLDGGCNFESNGLCGWQTDNSTSIQWHRHKANDQDIIDRSKGPRFDHTYGASSEKGHFLDVDVGHVGSPETKTNVKLISPLFKEHVSPKCIQFWYLFEGRDQESFTVNIQANDTLESVDVIDDNQGGEWKERRVLIQPQTQAYQIVMEVITCVNKCKNAVVAIDDVSITDGKCPEGDATVRNPLRVRLVGGDTDKEGRVEVQHEGQWGSVCSRKFGMKEAKVVCKSLGFSYANFTRNSTQYQRPEGMVVWLQRLQCSGKEYDLGDCLSRGEHWAETDCSPQEDAAVMCSNDAPLTFAPSVPTSSELSTTTRLHTPTSPTIPSSTLSTNSTQTMSQNPTEPSSTRSSTIITNPTSTSTVSSQPSSSVNPSSTTDLNPTPKSKPTSTITSTTASSTSKNDAKISPSAAVVSHPTPEMQDSGSNNAGVAIGIMIALVVAVTVLIVLLYKNKKKGKKNAYITFGNPSYSRENLPANDFTLDSPLTLSSSGYTVLA